MRRPARPHIWRRLATVPGNVTQMRRVEVADVDAELERVGGHHGQQVALGQPPLDLAPLGRRVAGAVGRDPLGQVGAARVLEAQPREPLDQLDAAARLQEADRAHVARDQRRPAAWRPRRGPSARLPSVSSTSGGFHIATWRSACGAPSRSTSANSRPVSRSASSTRVGDRRAREHEARLGAVGAGEPPQPAQHVGHVRAEHAAVDVRLVDHDPGEVGQHVAPAAVVGQHPHVQHVRVGEDQVRALADRAPLLARRVAVVDRVAQERAPPKLVQLARLVLGERLGRVEVERARPRVGGERVEHRQVEGERLAAGGAGRDDRRGPRRARLERVGLVRPERVDAGRSRAPRAAAGWRSSGTGVVDAPRRARSRAGRDQPPRSARVSSTALPGYGRRRGSRLAIVRGDLIRSFHHSAVPVADAARAQARAGHGGAADREVADTIGADRRAAAGAPTG